MIDLPPLLSALEEGTCIVTYEKVVGPDTGNLRAMACTLDPNRIPSHTGIKQSAENDHILVWCTDRDAWRSVRVSTIKEWKQCSDD